MRQYCIFLDTNALIQLLTSGKLASYKAFPALQFITFEKCTYEWKNGFKRHFINREVVLRAIKNPSKNKDTPWEEIQASSVIAQALEYLHLNETELNNLINAIKTSDLAYEFGVALENEGVSVEEMETEFYRLVRKDQQHDTGLLRLKQFYKIARDGIRLVLSEFDELLNSHQVKIKYYDHVFGIPLQISNFRSMVEDSYLPSEDLEIIFSAICSHCQLFVTAEKKVIKHSRTLGFNHALEFVHLEELDDRLAEWVPELAPKSSQRLED
jgi:hypothetical protein